MALLIIATISILFFFGGGHGRQINAAVMPDIVPLSQPSSDVSFTLIIALHSTNMDGLHDALMDVSDPASVNYGRHLSKDQVNKFVAPKPGSVRVVTNWLRNSGLKAKVASPAGELLHVEAAIHAANALLSANYTHFLDTSSGATLLGTLSYTIPGEVYKHIKFIYPTTQFIPPAAEGQTMKFEITQPPGPMLLKDMASADCFSVITPQCLQDLYNMPNATITVPGNSLAVAGFVDEFVTDSDLQKFFRRFRPDFATPNFDVMSINGGITNGNGTLEASLDIAYTVGLAPGVPTTFISDGDNYPMGFIDLANFLLHQTNIPSVLSVSYGFNESDYNHDKELARHFCDTYAQLGAGGTTVLFYSGDNGVYDFLLDCSCDATMLSPTFPSGCPYITSVGGTRGIPETASWFSGGGFSNIFHRPSYQDAAVTSYLEKLGSTHAGLYNATGRGFPDVSAQSMNFTTCINGKFNPRVYGTSASTPTFASIVALLNGQLLSAGKSPLGFINPLLYSRGASALNDITTGSNPGCGDKGFPAVLGWDPVTGLGTPDYEKLLDLVMSIAAEKFPVIKEEGPNYAMYQRLALGIQSIDYMTFAWLAAALGPAMFIWSRN